MPKTLYRQNLVGKKGGPNYTWALGFLCKPYEVLLLLYSLEPVKLSDKGRANVYRKFARSVNFDDPLYYRKDIARMLLWYAEHGLPKQVTDSLFDRAMFWYGMWNPDLSEEERMKKLVGSVYEEYHKIVELADAGATHVKVPVDENDFVECPISDSLVERYKQQCAELVNTYPQIATCIAKK